MTDETKDGISGWATDFIKSVGFPIAVSCAVLWFGFDQIRRNEARTEMMTQFALTTMKTLMEGNTQVIAQNNIVIAESTRSKNELTAALQRLNTTIESLERSNGQ